MRNITHMRVADDVLLVEYSDGTSQAFSAEDLLQTLESERAHFVEVSFTDSELEQSTLLASLGGQTVNEFIVAAIIEKIFREG